MRTSFRTLTILLVLMFCVSLTPVANAGNHDPNSDARAVSYDIAAEGAVLLENNGILPLKTDAPVSVFGRSQMNYVKGGGGSSYVASLELTNFIDGMKASGIVVNEALLSVFQEWCAANPLELGYLEMTSETSNPEMPLTDALIADAAEISDVAIVIIARNSTEGADHSEKAGDWYLNDEEKQMLEMINGAFDDVVVILNIGFLIDVSWIADYDSISAVLLAWNPGSYGNFAIGDILIGKVTPSGKLTDSWARNYSDYPANQYGSFGVDAPDPVYGEDIYVGYRYFETFDPAATLYEFGYGLSYTTFEQTLVGFEVDADKITLQVAIQNVGDTYAGKDTLQVYYSAPQGALGKPSRQLIAFGKTELLEPGESQTLLLTFKASEMASYDDSNATGHENCYVMEAGDYNISFGDSVKNQTQAGCYSLTELVVVEELQEVLAPQTDFQILKPGEQKEDGSYAVTTVSAAKRAVDNDVSKHYRTDLAYTPLRPSTQEQGGKIMLMDVYTEKASISDFIAQLSISEYVQIFGGHRWGSPLAPETAQGASSVYGHTITEYGVSISPTNCGPCGVGHLNLLEGHNGNTAYPVSVMLACTWNTELMERYGVSVGAENAYNEIAAWLAPAMNLNRDPFGGRHFEYYSEDPLMSGVCAAYVTRGVQSEGVGVTLKHFAANNQETNRNNGNSIVSERAMRELYLKSFQIAVEYSNPWNVMSSYNKINGSFAPTNVELCDVVLRQEWGFEGLLMTDWGAQKDDGNASMIRASHDLSMASLVTASTLPDGFTLTEDGSSIVCAACGEEKGGYITWRSGLLVLDPYAPCVNANCTRQIKSTEELASELPEGAVLRDTSIYRLTDTGEIYICELEEWVKDETDLITGLVDGRLTFGELERSANRILYGLMQSYNFRMANDLPLAEYIYDDVSPVFNATSLK